MLSDYGPVGAAWRTEVESRLVIGICCAVSTKGLKEAQPTELPFLAILLASFTPTAQSAYTYRLVVVVLIWEKVVYFDYTVRHASMMTCYY